MAAEEQKFEWNRARTLYLIQSYKNQPALWDFSSKEYRDRIKKNRILNDIAKDMGTTEYEVLRKWHNLRCQMNSEIRKIKQKVKTGQLAHEVKSRIKWEFFHYLQFMSDIQGCTLKATTSETKRSKVYKRNEKKGEVTLSAPFTRPGTVVYTSKKPKVLPACSTSEVATFLTPTAVSKTRPGLTTSSCRPSTIASVPQTPTVTVKLLPSAAPTINRPTITYAEPATSRTFITASTPKKMKNVIEEPLKSSNHFYNTPHKAMEVLTKHNDDSAIFGQYVAAELRSLRSDIRKRELKRIIQKAIVSMTEQDDNEFSYSSSAEPSYFSRNSTYVGYDVNSIDLQQALQTANAAEYFAAQSHSPFESNEEQEELVNHNDFSDFSLDNIKVEIH